MIQSKTVFACDVVRSIPKGDLKHYLDKMMQPWKVESFRVSNDAIVMEVDTLPDSPTEERGIIEFIGVQNTSGEVFFLAKEQTATDAWVITEEPDEAMWFDSRRMAETFIDAEDMHDVATFSPSPVVGGDDD